MNVKLFQDPVMDAAAWRALGHASFRGAEPGEVLAIREQIKDGDVDSWIKAWTEFARSLAPKASENVRDWIGARDAYLRASNYLRTAASCSFKPKPEQAAVDSFLAQYETFADFVEHAEYESVVVEIPFEPVNLRARILYTDFDSPKGTILHTTGYDSSGPEGWFWVAQPALERGYNVVLYEGPGQGAVLWDQGIPMRPDWENVFLPVVNTIRQQPGLDPDRLISWGTSLGGYLAVRGASVVPELRALILDPGQLGVKEAVEAQMGAKVAAALMDRDPQVEAQINQLINSPEMKFTLERGMLVHQLDTPSDYFREMMKYTNAPILDKITMPCWIAAAENDHVSATAKPLFEALPGPKVFQQFTAAEGCGEHCELGGRSRFLAEAFSWLDSLD